MNKLIVTTQLLLLLVFSAKADEGMWLPQLLKQMNESDMQMRGLKLSAEDIYSVNHTSLKDAVLLFGGGCTGEVISSQGLLLTNHHCGYSTIQSHSTVQHDYLTDGYWAKNREEELPCPGLTAMFIIRIENVTEQVTAQLLPEMSEGERDMRIKAVAALLEKKAVEGTHYNAFTRSFFYGNEFYMFVTETFKDVRLVGAPPSSIGKFGAETDNWVWPRQTGDFALFRIYAGADNKPAEYSKDNKPFTPRYHFTISLAGVKEGDFTMVYGFPGRTTEYLPSSAIAMTYETSNPAKISIREKKLQIMYDGMHLADSIRIAYAPRYSSISNYYKKWQGEQMGLRKNDAVEKKRNQEKQFMDWVLNDAGRKSRYAGLLPDFEKEYAGIRAYAKANDYITESLYGMEIVNFASNFKNVVAICTADSIDEAALKKATEKIAGSDGFFKNYHVPTDMRMCKEMLALYREKMDSSMLPGIYQTIDKKYKGSIDKYVDDLFKKTWMTSQTKVKANLKDFSAKNLKTVTGDPAWILYKSIADLQARVTESHAAYNERIIRLQRTYVTALREMQTTRKFYPDANLTLRLAYGSVKGIEPRDGMIYKYYTTLEGVMEKADSLDEEFRVPAKLTELYNKKDYGRYGRDGIMPVAFIASNHTSGGNSGSPVLNGKGELIGTNFDRIWEGVMSDYMFDPDLCRNITLDVRYTLFIIDKFAGAGYLVDEMTITQ